MSRTAYHCVDWGTTSFRLWAVAADGTVTAERRSSEGMSTLKPTDYESVLETALADTRGGNDGPVVICGMAGSAQGWMEAPYVDLPADLRDLPFKAVKVTSARRDVRILPGLAQRVAAAPDVIRGEETLLLGAVLDGNIEGTVCLPGTHSKWAEIDAGTVTGFRTAMTGEIFALMSKQSTLAHYASVSHGDFVDNPAFAAAVREAIAAPETILSLLFSVRATPLLMGSSTADAMPARLSGLLIGLELAGMKGGAGSCVTLISSGMLAQNYGYALQVAGIDFVQCNADDMALSGLRYAAHALWADQWT